MNILTAKGISKTFTDRKLLEEADFSLEDTDKVGIVGINGTGKSTLLRVLAGTEEPDEGEVIKGNRICIRFLPQNPEYPSGMTVYEYMQK